MTHARMDTLNLQPHTAVGWDAHSFEARLFARARERGQRGRFWERLARRPQNLMALGQVREACAIDGHVDAGARVVSISQIRGSESRSGYFDCDFNPLYDRARGRWLNIARARRQGKRLPPVSLVRVGDIYFVMDGHHRISVARALGESDIEARVTILQVAGRLPWETPEQDLGPRRARKTLRRGTALLQQWASLVLRPTSEVFRNFGSLKSAMKNL